MKKIISNKLYNTDSATPISTFADGFPTDFDYLCETLYLKKTGEFFIHGEGGARSKYAKSTGINSFCGGEEIHPLTLDEAKVWVENHADADIYLKLFGAEE